MSRTSLRILPVTTALRYAGCSSTTSPDTPSRPRKGVGLVALTAAQQRSRIGGLRTAALHDTRELTAPARAAFLARFEDEVDPDRRLPEDERQRRATAARRAYFSALALRSVQARRARKPMPS